MGKQLSVRLGGVQIGVLAQDATGKLSFAYDAGWIAGDQAWPISLALPLEDGPFGDRAVKAFFGGYLPDDDEIRKQIAKHFRISPNSPFQMLSKIGRDCAGALSLWPPDAPFREDLDRDPAFEVLDEMELAAKLRELKTRPLLAGPDRLRLSLAGAQSKTAVYVTNAQEIALTKDDYPSSHIIKPQLDDYYADVALIEYSCLELARRIGLRVPTATYGMAQGIPYVLVERYDRVRHTNGRIQRLHQEDFCQALQIPSERKYESEGGPGLAQCFEIVDQLRLPARERLRLLDLVIFNFLIGNADAHGKNFSVLYAPTGAELAPVYDVVSTLVYEAEPSLNLNPKMAMRIGREYRAPKVGPKQWQDLAGMVSLTWPAIRNRLDRMSYLIQTEARAIERELAEQGRTTPILHRAIDMVLDRGVAFRGTHELKPIPPEDLSGRRKEVGIEETVNASDGVSVVVASDERLDFDRRYRRYMTRLDRERRRLRLEGQDEEDRALAELGRGLTAAHHLWMQGGSPTEAEIDLLGAHVGPVPGHPSTAAQGPEEDDSVAAREPRQLVLQRGITDAGKEVRHAEAEALTAADLQRTAAVFLCAVPGQVVDQVSGLLSRSSALHATLAKPPRWRIGGWDLHTGSQPELQAGRVLRVTAKGYVSLSVSKDGTVDAAFLPGTDRVAVDDRPYERLNGLELAERFHLFADLVNAVLADVVTLDAVQVSLRWRRLQQVEPKLALGPNLPGTFGWQFSRGLRTADTPEIVGDVLYPVPLESGRVAHDLLQRVHLAFGVPMDGLPIIETRPEGDVLSRDAFLDYIDTLPGH